MKYFCKIYEKRPEWCVGYPWNNANDLFPDCQFMKDDILIPLEEMTRTKEEMEQYCISCGRCCMFWDEGKAIHKCSALRVEE